ncbi:hypothetical protein Cni_G09307 [Canna indica]|uniref:Reverse transcriptase domain-containing protein n=1 Tax=Canna indica TaxID=4628 RepID=A0AAQ3K224_9LILI|nr:hypothetical protein Cni_G09307 [Canna indica]
MKILIDNTQCAFMSGKSTLDSFMAAQEVVHLFKRRGEDMAKAFDNVDWLFLGELLCFRGFPLTWIKWIQSMLHSSESAVLLNGEAGKWFRHGKGLRQGDPLSPYLFLLVADVFSRLLQNANSCGLIKGIRIGNDKESLNLEFMDDFMVFTRGEESDIINLKLLYAFKRVSSLTVSYSKSAITHILGDSHKSDTVAISLGCKATTFPIQYLGLPLKHTNLGKNERSVVLDKIDKQLSSWKGRLLSRASRLTLINRFLMASQDILHLSLGFLAGFVRRLTCAGENSYGKVAQILWGPVYL